MAGGRGRRPPAIGLMRMWVNDLGFIAVLGVNAQYAARERQHQKVLRKHALEQRYAEEPEAKVE